MKSFVETPLTLTLQNNDHVKVFKSLLDKEYLSNWAIGTNHANISSKFQTLGGSEDTLTSPYKDDLDYPGLIEAHLQRAFELIQEERRH